RIPEISWIESSLRTGKYECTTYELIQFFNETESVSLNGDPYTGDGLDFKAETVNKEVQAWMPLGVPDGNDWLRVTRNLDKLKQLVS
ncbi:Hypothetical predicted protein, partial [Mytilus galloprovincialis]